MRSFFLAGSPATSSKSLEVRNKFTNAVYANCSVATDEQIEIALDAMSSAYAKTSQLSSRERARILHYVASELEKQKDAFTECITAEVGKTKGEALAEVTRAIDTFRFAAAAVLSERGEWLDLSVTARGENTWGAVRRCPVRGAVFITPFNFPLNLAAHKIAPAIAVGCPFILKPASVAPLSVLLLGEILAGAGLPGGAFSILPCSGEQAGKIAVDSRISAVSFTGSAEVGWKLKQTAWKKKVTLELGGNAAVIVCADYPLEKAAAQVCTAAFGLAGQSCISVQRIYVESSCYVQFKELLVAETSRLAIGDPADAKTSVGPMISEGEAIRIEKWIEEAVSKGARVLCGGTRSGSLMQPTLVENASSACSLMQKEAFAPVACLIPFNHWEDALRAVNASEFGLQTGLLTHDMCRIQEAWKALEVGGVIAGDVPTWRSDAMPYGGVKDSGFGREGVCYAMEELTEPRLLVVRT